jgi:hypothetical protein
MQRKTRTGNQIYTCTSYVSDKRRTLIGLSDVLEVKVHRQTDRLLILRSHETFHISCIRNIPYQEIL